MKLVPCEKIYTKYRGVNSDNLEIIMAFKEGNYECAKIEGYPHKDAKNCVGSLRNTIKNYKIRGIKASFRGDEVYLIKEDL